jgi:uncharacterized protein
MSRRPLYWILGTVLALVLLIWLIDSVSRLYFNAAMLSPALAQALLWLIGLLVVVSVGAIAYYYFQFNRPRKVRRPRYRPSDNKTEAATENLQAIDQQIDQIQDEVVRQELWQRSQEIYAQLSRRELRVVIFGTGSAGKTSLLNAIAGQILGETGATMGTTTVGQTYRFQLNNLERDIDITDTPGILEAKGTEREQLARQLAAEADLLLFVLNNDLRQSEAEMLRSLAEMGKRSLVVFNQIDLYPEADRRVILESIRAKVAGLIAEQDVVAIAANPRPVQLESGEWFQPQATIVPLLQRMAAVLRTEGEDLIADNILLQSQQLGTAARQMIDEQRLRQAEKVVDRFQWVTAGVVSMTPLPVVDLLATAAINAQMVVELGKVYDCELNLERGKELALSLAKTLVSLGVVRGAIELFTIALQTNLGTLLIGRALQGVTAAYLTRIAGRSFIEYFRRDQDWGDGGMSEVVQEQFRLNQKDEFMKVFVKEAMHRIVHREGG